MARRTVSSMAGSSRTTSSCAAPAVRRNVIARRAWLRTYSARFSGSFSVAATVESASRMPRRSRTLTPLLDQPPQTSVSSTRLDRLGDHVAHRRRRELLELVEQPLDLGHPEEVGGACTEQPQRRSRGPRPRSRRLPAPRGRARRCAGTSCSERTTLRRSSPVAHANARRGQAARRGRRRSARAAPSPSCAGPRARRPAPASRSSLTSRLQGTTSGTNAGSREPPARGLATGEAGSVAAAALGRDLRARLGAGADEQRRAPITRNGSRRQARHGREEQHEPARHLQGLRHAEELPRELVAERRVGLFAGDARHEDARPPSTGRAPGSA